MWKQKLSSKVVILGLIILALFLGDLKFRQWLSQRSIGVEEQNLKNQANTLQKKNNELNQSLSYLSSTDFKEKVARQELGYKKDGETVYGFTQGSGTSTQAENTQAAPSNAQKWWDYFFQD
jgi:cell division protein FtsB